MAAIPALAGSHQNRPAHDLPCPRRRTIGTPPSRSGLCSPREAPWGGPRPHVESRQPSLGRAVQLPDQLHGLLAEHGPGTGPSGPPALTQTAASLTVPYGFCSYCSQERSADPPPPRFGAKMATNRSALLASGLRWPPGDICLRRAAAVPQGASRWGGCGPQSGFNPTAFQASVQAQAERQDSSHTAQLGMDARPIFRWIQSFSFWSTACAP